MIRLTFVLRRKADLSREEFQEYWRDRHGPLVAKHARSLDALRYVQVHTLDDPLNRQMAESRGGMEPPYDGVAEMWWQSREHLAAVLESEEGQQAGQELLEDEKTFIDLEQSPLWLAYEVPQVNPTPENLVAHDRSPLVKLFFCIRPKEGMSEDDCQTYWRVQHGPLIRSNAHASGILRYVQVHRLADDVEGGLRGSRGTRSDAYSGHAELWFDRGRPGTATPERERAGREAIEDESRFIDFSRSAMWIAKERVVIDRPDRSSRPALTGRRPALPR